MPGPAVPLARVAVITERACLVAGLAAGPRRVLDLLNDPAASTLSLVEPSLVDIDRLEHVRGAFPAGRLRKSDLVCVAVLSEPELPPDRRLGRFVPKQPARVVLLLRSLAVVGTLHVAGRPADVLDTALAWPEPFLALTEAGLLPGGTPIPDGEPPDPVTVLVNRAHVIAALGGTAAPATANGAPEPPARRYGTGSLVR